MRISNVIKTLVVCTSLFFSTSCVENPVINVPTSQSSAVTLVPQATSTIIATPRMIDTESPTVSSLTSPSISIETVPVKIPTTLPSTNEPIQPSQSVGSLSVKVPSRCSPYYNLKVGDQTISSGSFRGTMKVIEGNYDLTLRGNFGTEVVIRGIAIQANKETILDASNEFGLFFLSPYDNLHERLAYFFVGQNDSSSVFNRDYAEYICGTPGVYTVELTNAIRVANILDILNYYAVPQVLSSEKITFPVEIKPGETTISEPDTWPQQLGLLSFTPEDSFRAFDMNLYELEDGVQTEIETYYGYELPFNAGRAYWMLPGKYRIELTKEIVGLTYEFEIKAGEETVLQLPSSP